jgi:hypothetical protein
MLEPDAREDEPLWWVAWQECEEFEVAGLV